MDTKFIGERITELRLKKGVSEYQMSYDLGRNKNYVRSITSGRCLPSMDGLFSIFEYFEITPAEFFAESEYPQTLKKAIEYMKQLDDENMLLLLPIIEAFLSKQEIGSSNIPTN